MSKTVELERVLLVSAHNDQMNQIDWQAATLPSSSLQLQQMQPPLPSSSSSCTSALSPRKEHDQDHNDDQGRDVDHAFLCELMKSFSEIEQAEAQRGILEKKGAPTKKCNFSSIIIPTKKLEMASVLLRVDKHRTNGSSDDLASSSVVSEDDGDPPRDVVATLSCNSNPLYPSTPLEHFQMLKAARRKIRNRNSMKCHIKKRGMLKRKREKHRSVSESESESSEGNAIVLKKDIKFEIKKKRRCSFNRRVDREEIRTGMESSPKKSESSSGVLRSSSSQQHLHTNKKLRRSTRRKCIPSPRPSES